MNITEALSERYRVEVDGYEIPVYNARVSAQPFNRVWPGYQRPLEQTALAAFASFDSNGEKEVRVYMKNGTKNISVKPKSLGIGYETFEGGIVFKLSEPCFIVIESGDCPECLHLFSNAPASVTVEDAIYYEAGTHCVDEINLKSGSNLHIAENAVVYGKIRAKNADNVTICGRGILCGSKCEPNSRNSLIILENCKNVVIEGIILRDSANWTLRILNCSNILISGIKLIGMWKYNSDGIDVVNSQNVQIRNCFVRTFDDCVAVKGMKKYAAQNTENVLVTGCVVYSDWGRAFEVGAETCGERIENIVFEKSIVLKTTHVALDIQHTDGALIYGVVFRDIYVEMNATNMRPKLQNHDSERYMPDTEISYLPQLILIEIAKNMWSSDAEVGRVQNVSISDITVEGCLAERAEILLKGADAEHQIKGVVLENINIGGKMAEVSSIIANEFVEFSCRQTTPVKPI